MLIKIVDENGVELLNGTFDAQPLPMNGELWLGVDGKSLYVVINKRWSYHLDEVTIRVEDLG